MAFRLGVGWKHRFCSSCGKLESKKGLALGTSFWIIPMAIVQGGDFCFLCKKNAIISRLGGATNMPNILAHAPEELFVLPILGNVHRSSTTFVVPPAPLKKSENFVSCIVVLMITTRCR